MPGKTYCKKCGLPIFFARTTAGKRMPLDDSTDPVGNIRIISGIVEVLDAADAALAQERGELLFKPHAPTCMSRRSRGRAVGMPPDLREAIEARKRRGPRRPNG